MLTKASSSLSLTKPTIFIYAIDYQIIDEKNGVILKEHRGPTFERLLHKDCDAMTKTKVRHAKFRMYMHKALRIGEFTKEVLTDTAAANKVLTWAENKSSDEIDTRLRLVGLQPHPNLKWHLNNKIMSVKRYRRKGPLSFIDMPEDSLELRRLITNRKFVELIS